MTKATPYFGHRRIPVWTRDSPNARAGGGLEKPLAHASKRLTDALKRYSQIKRKTLAIIYGVTKFYQYLYGRKFKLICDHKPLVSIFSTSKNLPTLTICLQRYAITLEAYQFRIEYKPTG